MRFTMQPPRKLPAFGRCTQLFLLISVCQLILPADSALSRITPTHVQWYKTAQDNLHKIWTFDPKLVCASAGRHGLQNKTVMGSANPSLEHNMNSEVADLFWFEKMPIYAPTKFLISHKYKFIFVRQPKSSSSAIIDSIQKTFCGGEKCGPGQLVPLITLQGTDHLWKDYFVFTWVRNPFSRLVSAYKMMTGKYLYFREGGYAGTEVGAPCGVSFSTFSENSNTLRADCQERGCCVYIPAYKQWIPWFIAAHINDQAHAVFVGYNASMVDYIGRTEHIDDDWADMLTHYNRRMGTDFQAMRFELVNQADETEKELTQDASEPCPGYNALQEYLNETTMSNIAHQYARDLFAFGYLPGSPSWQGWGGGDE